MVDLVCLYFSLSFYLSLVELVSYYPSPTRSVCEDTLVDVFVSVCVCVCVLALNS